LADMFWGGYFGSFTDKFGVQWMLNVGNEQPT
jgi:PhnB protein